MSKLDPHRCKHQQRPGSLVISLNDLIKPVGILRVWIVIWHNRFSELTQIIPADAKRIGFVMRHRVATGDCTESIAPCDLTPSMVVLARFDSNDGNPKIENYRLGNADGSKVVNDVGFRLRRHETR